MSDSYLIAHVTPYPWESGHEVNRYIDATARELSRRGHSVVILAPSHSIDRLTAGEALLSKLIESPGRLNSSDRGPTVIGLGEPISSAGAKPRALPPPTVDLSRQLQPLLRAVPFDFVHVHDPFAPSIPSQALRYSHSLNIGSFHLPQSRIISTQVARRFVELFFGRLDIRVCSFGETERAIRQAFGGRYDLIPPGVSERPSTARSPEVRPLEIVYCDREERGALHSVVRALRKLPRDSEWHATVFTTDASQPPVRLPRDVAERLTWAVGDHAAQTEALCNADVAIAASNGSAPAPSLLIDSLSAGAIPVASQLPVYEELMGYGDYGPLFFPRDHRTLTAQLCRLISDSAYRERCINIASKQQRSQSWSDAVDRLEQLMHSADARRHRHRRPSRSAHAVPATRKLIDVDLHMHTDHSYDCATPVEVLLSTARKQGLGAIAITDHNEISGALEAAEKAADFGVKIIVAEEVKTAEQGEVIGLFIREKIPRGLSLAETIAEIRRQDGLVYVPHPFDRFHSVPDYEHLLEIIHEIDVLEVFNPRVAIPAFNEEVRRFALKYDLVAGAGSDSHVPQGLGSVRIRMRDFDGPDQFLASLREADIVRRRSSLLYVQALKFLQTKATPPAARQAARTRRIRRANDQRITGRRK